MRILYGVCGEGLGHSSRAKEVIPFLQKKGHKVKVICYGDSYRALKNKFDCLKVEGVSPYYLDGEMRFKGTVKSSLDAFYGNLKNSLMIKKEIEKFAPEICITDMEPLVPIIRRLYGLPLISFDNQHRLTHLKFKVPFKYWKDYLVAKTTVKRCVSRADSFVIVSFANLEKKSKEQNVHVVSPLLRKEIGKLKPMKGKKVLVYLSRDVGDVEGILKKINERFVVYGLEKKGSVGNIEFKKKGSWFLKDLKDCKAVIGTAGFSLIAESLYLKKPYFAIPLKGQFEQILNALLLKEKGFGDSAEKITKKNLEKFFSRFEGYQKKLEQHKMNPCEALEVLGEVLEG